MLRFNTMAEDPYVNLIIDEMEIVNFLTDHKAYDKLRKLEAGVKSPSRPSNLIYVDFFFDSRRKIMFLLLGDDKKLGLKFPVNLMGQDRKLNKVVLISARSSKAMIKFFSECARIDPPQQSAYFNVQYFLNQSFRRSEIPIE